MTAKKGAFYETGSHTADETARGFCTDPPISTVLRAFLPEIPLKREAAAMLAAASLFWHGMRNQGRFSQALYDRQGLYG